MRRSFEYDIETVTRERDFMEKPPEEQKAIAVAEMNRRGAYGWDLIKLDAAVAGGREILWRVWKRELQ